MTRWLAFIVLVSLAFDAVIAIAASCSISASSIIFGVYDAATNSNSVGTVTVNCSDGVIYDIRLNAGTAMGAIVTRRNMTGKSSDLLGYRLFSDASRTINWGDNSGTGEVTGTGTHIDQRFNIFAQIPRDQHVAPGSFNDKIIATLSGRFNTRTAQISVIGVAQPACAITARPLEFGIYSGTQVNAATTISVTCTPDTAYVIGLGPGLSPRASVPERNMLGPQSAVLSYELFSNSTHTSNWGHKVGSDTLTGHGTGATKSIPVYGHIPGGQTTRPGNFVDTITATITY